MSERLEPSAFQHCVSMDLSEYWLIEEQFERLRPLLPNKVRGVPRADDRRVISGIIQLERWAHRFR